MRWRIQFMLLVMLMSGLVMGGIHLAERGIQRVEGVQDGPVQSFRIVKADDDKLEMTVLGREYYLEDQGLLSSLHPPDQSAENKSDNGLNLDHIGIWAMSISNMILDWIKE